MERFIGGGIVIVTWESEEISVEFKKNREVGGKRWREFERVCTCRDRHNVNNVETHIYMLYTLTGTHTHPDDSR